MVAGAAAIGVAGCGGGGAADGTGAAPATASTVAGPPVATTRQPRPRRSAGEIKLDRLLTRSFELAGHATSAYVYDLTTGEPLFALRSGVKRPPASVEKLFTTVAVLGDLGPNLRLHTFVLGTGHLGAGGVWHGDLYLRGGGDPTLGDGAFNRVYEHGDGPTAAQLAGQLIRDGIRRVTGKLIGDASLFDARRGPPSTGYQPDIPDLGGQLAALTYDHGATLPAAVAHGGVGGTSTTRRLHPAPALTPGAMAARELALTMRTLHVSVSSSTSTATTPRRARQLAIVTSPPMSVLLRLMDVPSDDFFAEMLTKQLGARIVGHGSTAAGAYAISSAIRNYRLHPRIVDGSGLSRDDLASPAEVVDLLRSIRGTATGNVLAASLPTVGVNGTVQTIATGTAAVGRCIAKTGTLDNVTNLAGYCRSRGHQLLAFALFLDGPPNWSALTLIGRMIADIAKY